jgi:outer membrane PBP1 activator LpoA protein
LQVKDTHSGYERVLLENEAQIDKARSQFSKIQDELERFLVAKEGENLKEARMQAPAAGSSGKRGAIGLQKAVAKGGMLLKGKNPRQEDDVRARVSAASDAYRKVVLDTQALRQEYFNFQLPRTLKVRWVQIKRG